MNLVQPWNLFYFSRVIFDKFTSVLPCNRSCSILQIQKPNNHDNAQTEDINICLDLANNSSSWSY